MSYEQKHNEANGEENRDGADDNHTWNCGVEGPTEDPVIIELRERQKRNLWCALMFAQGSPMISGGDELSRTQQGNNNAYCQDSELSWYHWDLDDRRKAFLDFAQRIVQYRKRHPNFHRYAFYDNDPDALASRTRTSSGSAPTASAWAPRIGRTAAGCARSACS